MQFGDKTTKIVCRTYDGDVEWLAKAIPTWLEHCKEYDGIYVTGIEDECKKVQAIAGKYGVEFIPHNESKQVNIGYINQQHTKLCADQLVDADYILFVDADTLCYEDHTPDVWFEDDKPVMLYSAWGHVGQAVCWKVPMLKALGWKPPYEFMRRLPLLYRSDTITACREYIEYMHGVPLWLYLANEKSFSEFNVLGMYAYEHEYDKYYWSIPEVDRRFPNPFKQFWSHGGLGKQIEEYEHQ